MTIELRDLSFDYGTRAVLRDVRGTARAGAITVVMGPNAIGKTTLLRCIAGTLRADGAILVDGRPRPTRSSRALVSRLAYVAQRPSVSADLTVREVVALGRYALPRDPGRLDDALATLELTPHADRPFADLSVGQQQRVALARALAQADADGNLVLDEPTAAMDLRHAAHVAEVLRDRARRGSAILMTSHDLTAAAEVADDVWLFDRDPPGRLCAAGPASEALTVERLEHVFGVPFTWLEHPVRGRVLVGGGRVDAGPID